MVMGSLPGHYGYLGHYGYCFKKVWGNHGFSILDQNITRITRMTIAIYFYYNKYFF